MSSRTADGSPVGKTAAAARGRRARRSDEYRAAQDRLAPYEAIARFVIKRRAELPFDAGPTRRSNGHEPLGDLAHRKRQHRTSVPTLQRLAEALEVRFVMGFETGSPESELELITKL